MHMFKHLQLEQGMKGMWYSYLLDLGKRDSMHSHISGVNFFCTKIFIYNKIWRTCQLSVMFWHIYWMNLYHCSFIHVTTTVVETWFLRNATSVQKSGYVSNITFSSIKTGYKYLGCRVTRDGPISDFGSDTDIHNFRKFQYPIFLMLTQISNTDTKFPRSLYCVRQNSCKLKIHGISYVLLIFVLTEFSISLSLSCS